MAVVTVVFRGNRINHGSSNKAANDNVHCTSEQGDSVTGNNIE